MTVRDVSLILGISEKEVMDLAQIGKIPAYKIGGVYLRFKPEQVEEFRKSVKPVSPKTEATQKHLPHSSRHHPGASGRSFSASGGFKDKVSDFFYFNDFYILSAILILLILFIIFRAE